MKHALWIERALYAAYGLAAGYLLAYVAINMFLFEFRAWVDGAAVAAVVAMLVHRPVQAWAWAAMKRRIVRRQFAQRPPKQVPVWDRHTDYPENFVLSCCGLIFKSTAPTGPGHGNAASPLDDGQRVWSPL